MDILIKDDKEVCRLSITDNTLTLDELVSVYPGATGLKYTDEGDPISGVVVVKDGTFIPPTNGWNYPGRLFIVVRGKKCMGFKSFLKKKTCDTKAGKSSTVPSSSIGKIIVGIGEWVDGKKGYRFKKIIVNNGTRVGGTVSVHPVDRHTTSPEEICKTAVLRFTEQNRHLFDKSEGYTLVYPDGSKVDKTLPDKYTQFSLSSYKAYKGVTFDRLRLYICKTNTLPENCRKKAIVKRVEFSDDDDFEETALSLKPKPKSTSASFSFEPTPSTSAAFSFKPTASTSASFSFKPTGSTSASFSFKPTASTSASCSFEPVPSTLASFSFKPIASTSGSSSVSFHGNYHIQCSRGSHRSMMSIDESILTEKRKNSPPKKMQILNMDLIHTFGSTVYGKPEKFKIQQLETMNRCGKFYLTWSTEEDLIIVPDIKSFSSGAMRNAYLAKVLRGPSYIDENKTYVLKLHQKVILDLYNYEYGSEQAKRLVEKEVQTQSFAKMLCDEFSQLHHSLNLMRVIPVYKSRGPCGKHFTLEEYISGQWIKYNSNDGTTLGETENYKVVNSFSHWCLEKTNYMATVLDMQGVDLCISDVEVACTNERLFGCGNLGTEAIRKFARTHTCTDLCSHLGLEDIKVKYKVQTPVKVDSEVQGPDAKRLSNLPSLIDLTQSSSSLPRFEDIMGTQNIPTSSLSSSSKQNSNTCTERREWKCCVCLTFCEGSGASLIPCGHSQFCLNCALELKQQGAYCAICRMSIHDVLKIYL